MGKLKRIVPFLKKYYFWVLCVCIAIVAMGCWTHATLDLTKQYTEKRKKTEENYTNMKGISNQSPFPIEKASKKINSLAVDLQKDVAAAWQYFYKQQRDQNQLPEKLSKAFKDAFERSITRGEAIPKRLCEHYQNTIRDTEVPKLFELVGMARSDAGPEGRGSSASRAPGERIGKVEWDDAQCKGIEQRFTWSKAPNPREVQLAQEDLWVYKALLQVIRNTNLSAKRGETAVKKIESLKIGQDANRERTGGEAIAKPSAPTAAPGVPTAATPEETKPELLLLADRYVDDEGKPLGANDPAPYEQFNLVPFTMRLVIDQKKMVAFLAECAKSSMRIDVRQVRFQGQGPPSASETAAPGPGGGPSGRPGGDRLVGGTDVSMEVRGVVFIFNPPNKKILGTESAGEAKPEEAASEAATIPPAAEETPAQESSPTSQTDAPPGEPSPKPDSTDAQPTGPKP
jgi:hypothetical protein